LGKQNNTTMTSINTVDDPDHHSNAMPPHVMQALQNPH
jgi:hypothetical protein